MEGTTLRRGYYSGVFVGQFYDAQGNTEETFQWTLTLSPYHAFPKVFGAVRPIASGELVNILQGDWDSDALTIDINETSIKNSSILCQYTGKIVLGPNSIVIQGSWIKSSKDIGSFVCRREEDNDKAHVTGYWTGDSIPDKSQRSYIPTNPINWCLSIVLASGEEDKESVKEGKESDTMSIDPVKNCPVFGSGYFSDAADVPDKPVLFYSLSGTWNREANELQLAKIYESSEETEGYVIEYKGKLVKGEKVWKIEGAWDNSKGGSKGTFTCSQMPSPFSSGNKK